jgi:phytoene synthase
MCAALRARPVTEQSPDTLPPEADLALAWSPQMVRAPLSIAFQLDRRLARIVARTSEPMLGQMRLAWWRDALGTPIADRPRGDAVLDAIGTHWAGREAALVAMVDGWEVLVIAERLGRAEIDAFGTQRGAFFGTLDDAAAKSNTARITAAGFRWAIADAATSVSDAAERAALVEAGLARIASGGPMPKALRGLAVLDALAQRALRGGGRPLMEGRGAPLAALRAAIFLR